MIKQKFDATMFMYAAMGLMCLRSNIQMSDIAKENSSGYGEMRIFGPAVPTFEEDMKTGYGFDGMDDTKKAEVRRVWEQRVQSHRGRMDDLAREIRQMLDGYDITFSGSEVRFGFHHGLEGERMLIKVKYPVLSEDARQKQLVADALAFVARAQAAR